VCVCVVCVCVRAVTMQFMHKKPFQVDVASLFPTSVTKKQTVKVEEKVDFAGNQVKITKEIEIGSKEHQACVCVCVCVCVCFYVHICIYTIYIHYIYAYACMYTQTHTHTHTHTHTRTHMGKRNCVHTYAQM
jgi:hypothetical protein